MTPLSLHAEEEVCTDVWLSFQMESGELIPLLIAAGGGGNAYLEDPESSMDLIPLEQYENSTLRPGANGRTGAAGTLITRNDGGRDVKCFKVLHPPG